MDPCYRNDLIKIFLNNAHGETYEELSLSRANLETFISVLCAQKSNCKWEQTSNGYEYLYHFNFKDATSYHNARAFYFENLLPTLSNDEVLKYYESRGSNY